LLLAGALALAAPACSGPGPEVEQGGREEGLTRARVITVEEGMTMEQVLSAWGSPNVKVRQGSGERWSYWLRDEGRRVVGKTYVFFDDQGRVSEVVTPPRDEPQRKPPAPTTAARSADATREETL